ncbi:hypothetical protein CR983_02255 [Candidatus Saccharibacteria bacterium]|nr:MAG: hypothetical protein CR983_02255 [Candidatus Saccharibacteria bacterium]
MISGRFKIFGLVCLVGIACMGYLIEMNRNWAEGPFKWLMIGGGICMLAALALGLLQRLVLGHLARLPIHLLLAGVLGLAASFYGVHDPENAQAVAGATGALAALVLYGGLKTS